MKNKREILAVVQSKDWPHVHACPICKTMIFWSKYCDKCRAHVKAIGGFDVVYRGRRPWRRHLIAFLESRPKGTEVPK
jgi:hypothetical protein